MNASSDSTWQRRLRDWWLTPARPGLQRLIHPWEYRNLRRFAVIRIVGGCIATAAGVICLAYSAYAWAAFFLVIGVLDLAGGFWFLTIARSETYRAAFSG